MTTIGMVLKILFIQTSDITYLPLLEQTSRTVRRYCLLFRCEYLSYVGVMRGFHPWHAAYNRILMLDRLVEDEYSGWVCYLDADAFINDLSFDLRAYLHERRDKAFIAAPGGDPPDWWNINDGVFMINLSHPVAKAIVKDWTRRFLEISVERLATALHFSSVPDDQSLLWETLQSHAGAETALLVERSRPLLINYMDGFFIRQVLRVDGSLQERRDMLKSQIDKLLGRQD